MSTEPNGGGEQDNPDAGGEGGAETAPPSEQETESENEEQVEASEDDLQAEAEELLKEEKPAEAPAKQEDTKAKNDFATKDESIRLDAQLLKEEGKTNLEIVKELTESGLHTPEQINRLKKIMASGKLEEPISEGAAEKAETEEQKFERWSLEREGKGEKATSTKWFSTEYAKELGINSKTNAVAIESRKKLLTEAKAIYDQTSPEHRNFKRSLQLAAASLGLTNKTKTQEAIKKAVKTSRTKVDPNTGEPQKTNKSSYTFTELNEILKKDRAEGKRLIRLQREGKIKLVNDQS